MVQFWGTDSFRKIMEDWFATFESLYLVINDVTLVPAGESIFAVGTATYELTAKDGSLTTLREVWTDVRQKIGGRWIYVLDHAHVLTTPDQ
jgi:ketosteroid isomerase-like protein